MSEISEIRAKIKDELIEKWTNIIVVPETDLYRGNFVPNYYPLSSGEYTIAFSLNAIEYHIRMLDDIREYITRVQKNIGFFINSIEEKYAIQRLENAITLLENHRAELIYTNFVQEVKKLKDVITKKDLLQLDFNIHVLYKNHFKDNGYVKPYLNGQL